MTTMVFPRLLELNEELFLQVLTKVPIKYLIRLRCVSKRFLDLTNNHDFISFYHLQTKTNPNLLLDFNFNDTIPRLSPPPPLPDDSSLSSSTTNINVANLWRFHILIKASSFIYLGKQRHELIPFRCQDRKILLSSFDGLLCFAGLKFIEIYNILSGVNFLVESPVVGIYAFGFDPKSKDYKIVCFSTDVQWEMFSLRTHTWKPLVVNASISWMKRKNSLTICIDGVIYWPIKQIDFEEEEIVFHSFNLHQEKLIEIKPPPLTTLPNVQYSDLQLLSFRGSPCFVYMKRARKVGRTSKSQLEETRLGSFRFRLELFIMKYNGRGENNVEVEDNVYWIRDSIVTPFWFPKDVHIVSLYDEIYLTWFEAKHLQLYNLHTKCFSKLPRSPIGVYYPKVSRNMTKHYPTYVENVRFDFSLI